MNSKQTLALTGAGMTQASVRSSNLALVLRTIIDSGAPLSRADIAARLGMTRSTVSRLVDDLVAGQVVAEGETVSGARGRPAVPLSIRGGSVVGLGLEANVDRLVATLVDLAGNVLTTEAEQLELPELDFDDAMSRLSSLATAALKKAPDGARLVGSVLAIPGLVDRDGQTILRSPNLGWDGRSPGEAWPAEGLGTLRVANDIDCSALTVLRENPNTSFVYVTGEVGIGAAVSLDGELMLGRHGWASELGHICVDPQGDVCGCGATGCLETVAGLRHTLERAGQPDVESMVEALEAGDERAQTTVDELAAALGIALGAALNLLDISTVQLGGHLATLHPWLGDKVAKELQVRVLWAHHSGIDVVPVAEAPLRAAQGAAIAATASVVRDPASWIDPHLER